MVMELTRDNYDAEIFESKEPVLVDFLGPQCRPCLGLMPVVEEIEKEYNGKVKFGKVDASTNRMLCAKLRVLGLPTIVFYKDGAEITRLTGDNIGRDDLIAAVEKVISS